MTNKAIPNKAAALALDRKVLAGVDKYFATAAKVTVAGTDFTPASLKAVFQTDIDAQNALDAGRAQVKALTASQRTARKTMRAIRRSLRTYLLGNYGEQAVTMLDDFGLAPTKTTVKTVAAKAQALAKSEATRKAHEPAKPAASTSTTTAK